MNADDNNPAHKPFGPGKPGGWEPQPIRWPSLNSDAAHDAWHDLDAWTRWCVTRYGLDHRTIPPCWYRHGALVEELSALASGWQAAHCTTAPASGPLEWHSHFTAARTRLTDWVARCGCRPDQHRDQHLPTWVAEPDADFLAHVHHDLASRNPPSAHQACAD